MFFRAAVAVCGLGGLGSHIAMALARAGVGRLILIDDDVVDAPTSTGSSMALPGGEVQDGGSGGKSARDRPLHSDRNSQG